MYIASQNTRFNERLPFVYFESVTEKCFSKFYRQLLDRFFFSNVPRVGVTLQCTCTVFCYFTVYFERPITSGTRRPRVGVKTLFSCNIHRVS